VEHKINALYSLFFSPSRKVLMMLFVHYRYKVLFSIQVIFCETMTNALPILQGTFFNSSNIFVKQ